IFEEIISLDLEWDKIPSYLFIPGVKICMKVFFNEFQIVQQFTIVKTREALGRSRFIGIKKRLFQGKIGPLQIRKGFCLAIVLHLRHITYRLSVKRRSLQNYATN